MSPSLAPKAGHIIGLIVSAGCGYISIALRIRVFGFVGMELVAMPRKIDRHVPK